MPGSPFEQGVAHPELVGDQRVTLVHHPDELAVRAEDAVDLVYDPLRMLGVVDHAPGINDVEGGVRVRQRFRVGPLEVRFQAVDREMGLRGPDGRVGQVHPVTHGTGLGPLHVIHAGPNADFKEPSASPALESGHFQDVRFLLVAVPLNGIEPLRAPTLDFPCNPRAGAAGFPLPVLPYCRLRHGCPSRGKFAHERLALQRDRSS